jgi:hypothetical protein
MGAAQAAADGYEYYEHRDGDFYRRPAGEGLIAEWETALKIEQEDWKLIPVTLSMQDLEHLYPMDPLKVAEARG